MSRDRIIYARICAAAVFMLGAAFVAGSALRSGREPWQPVPLLSAASDAIPNEADTFRFPSKGPLQAESSRENVGARTLENFDSRRAFPGAPPVIPHSLLEDRSMGGKGCLGCHRDGGFVPLLKAYAPVTPHPDLMNCRQCHVAQEDTARFAAGSNWHKISGPAVNQEALSGAPPPIPHSLDMRGNCVACHGGPGAVAEIRTPHAERANCRQCHVPTVGTADFDRGGAR